jgi:Bacterial Ig domain
MLTRVGVLGHRFLKSALDISVPRADITAMSRAASENRDIERAVGTAWFLFLISTTVIWLTIFELNGTVRVVVTILFAITAPGWTVTAFLLPLEPAMEWSLAVALSLSISIGLSMLMLLSGWWTPIGMMLALACVVAFLQILHISVLSQRRRFWLDNAYSGNVEDTLGWTLVGAGVPLGFRAKSIARSRLGQRILRVRQQLSTQEVANLGAADRAAVEEQKVGRAAADAEKVDGEKELASAQDYRMRVEKAELPDKVREAALLEVGKLERTSDHSSEFEAIRAWLDTVLALPWSAIDSIAIQRKREVDPAATDRKTVDGKRVDPTRPAEIAWPLPAWAADTEMVDAEKEDPTRPAEIAWPLPAWAADTEMVDAEKEDPTRPAEIAWPLPAWAADTEMVDDEKLKPAAVEVEKAEAAHAGPHNDDMADTPPVAVLPLRAVLLSRPSQGTLTRNADGSFTYSPEGNLNGSDSFTYGVSDGNPASDSATVTVTVTARKHLPTGRVGADRKYSRDDNSVTVSLTGPDMENFAADFTLNAGSSNLALVSTSNVNFAASGAALTVTVGAGNGRSGTPILTLAVTDRQACNSVQVTVEVGGSGTDNLIGGADETSLGGSDNDRLTERVGRGPSQRRQWERPGKRHHRRRGRHR